MMVVGFDPGSLRFGVGILTQENGQVRVVHHETIVMREKAFYSRMKHLWDRLDLLFEGYSIAAGAMEEGFMGRNVRSMSVLSQVRGVATAMLINRNVPLETYSPRTVKQALTGNGNAEKMQVRRMLERLLKIALSPADHDSSDALAVAYCHLLSARNSRGGSVRAGSAGRGK